MIGYKVTASASGYGTVIYSGWSEGGSWYMSMAKLTAAKTVVKVMAMALVKGTVLTVVDIVTLPLQGMGSAAGNLIAKNLMKINTGRAKQALAVYDCKVKITGSFEAEYVLKSGSDLDDLPKLLALLPEKGTTKSFMGERVYESAFMAHTNFLRKQYNRMRFTVGRRKTVLNLSVKIEL